MKTVFTGRLSAVYRWEVGASLLSLLVACAYHVGTWSAGDTSTAVAVMTLVGGTIIVTNEL